MHIALWVVQVLAGLAFVAAGLFKAATPHADIAAQMAWAADFSPGMVKFIGLSELLGGLGLILPSATRIAPRLTPLAGALLVVVMALAAITHVRLGEPEMIAPNLVLGGMAAFVAWGRFAKAPIAPRG